MPMPDAQPSRGEDGSYQRVLIPCSLTYPPVLTRTIFVVLRVREFPIQWPSYLTKPGYRLAQVRVVFKLPTSVHSRFETLQAKHLAYIEWFSPFTRSPEPHHGLHKVSRVLPRGLRESEIIEVSRIRQSIHLFPCFGGTWRSSWAPETVLDRCDTYLVNSFQNRQSYLTVY